MYYYIYITYIYIYITIYILLYIYTIYIYYYIYILIYITIYIYTIYIYKTSLGLAPKKLRKPLGSPGIRTVFFGGDHPHLFGSQSIHQRLLRGPLLHVKVRDVQGALRFAPKVVLVDKEGSKERRWHTPTFLIPTPPKRLKIFVFGVSHSSSEVTKRADAAWCNRWCNQQTHRWEFFWIQVNCPQNQYLNLWSPFISTGWWF